MRESLFSVSLALVLRSRFRIIIPAVLTLFMVIVGAALGVRSWRTQTAQLNGGVDFGAFEEKCRQYGYQFALAPGCHSGTPGNGTAADAKGWQNTDKIMAWCHSVTCYDTTQYPSWPIPSNAWQDAIQCDPSTSQGQFSYGFDFDGNRVTAGITDLQGFCNSIGGAWGYIGTGDGVGGVENSQPYICSDMWGYGYPMPPDNEYNCLGNKCACDYFGTTCGPICDNLAYPKEWRPGYAMGCQLLGSYDTSGKFAPIDMSCSSPTGEVCGNSVIEGGEECDDGNEVDTDACTNACEAAICGDTIVRSGTETCDDGNGVNTDACVSCQAATCGDGYIQTGTEECDDGNEVDTDACTNACEAAICGDTIVRSGTETCDDGNDVNTDACVSCQAATCGDGYIQTGTEECDDGNEVDTDACTNACETAICGDGYIQTGTEECDDSNSNVYDACTATCQNAACGDGVIRTDKAAGQEGYENCDDGNLTSGDGCSSLCLGEGKTAYCGDGTADRGENCDESTKNGQPGHCNKGCSGQTTYCGDGIVQSPNNFNQDELCDGGPNCSASCTCAAGFLWNSALQQCTQCITTAHCSSLNNPAHCLTHSCNAAGSCVEDTERLDCSCVRPPDLASGQQKTLAALTDLSFGKSSMLLAAAGSCTAKEAHDCNFENSCGKIHYTNTWSGPGCCDGGGSTDLILPADDGNFVTINYFNVCAGAGTGIKKIEACPCGSSSSSSSSSARSLSSMTSVLSEGQSSSSALSSSKSSSKSSSRPSSASSSPRSSSLPILSSSASSTSSAAPLSSSLSSSSESSAILIGGLCMGTECELGGDVVCAAYNKQCIFTGTFPCIRCAGGSSLSSSSRQSSSQKSLSSSRIRSSSSQSFAFSFSSISSTVFPVIASSAGFILDEPSPEFTVCTTDLTCAFDERCVIGNCLTPIQIAQLPPFCGNARIDPGENCDDGAQNSLQPNALCRTDCTPGRCGDFILDTPLELCEDGNLTDGDGCSSLCQPERAAPQVLPAQIVELPFAPSIPHPPASSAAATPATPLPPANADTGPAALAVMVTGAALGYAWRRRRS